MYSTLIFPIFAYNLPYNKKNLGFEHLKVKAGISENSITSFQMNTMSVIVAERVYPPKMAYIVRYFPGYHIARIILAY